MIDQERIQRILRPVLLGFDETQRDSLERALEAIVGEMSTAAKPDAEPRVRIEPSIQANPNSYLRLKPPPLGQSLQLPAPRKCQAGDWVEVSIEAPEGTLRVVALPYDEGARGPRINATVNGLEFASFLASGFVRFVTNGDDRWSSSAEFPVESAAAQRIASNGAAGATGATGDTGGQGFPGRAGAPGMRGDRGYPGQPGPVGSEGRQGPPGPAGRWALPAMMIPGVAGAAGPQGTPGAPGMRGGPGERGYPGCRGTDGRMGMQGPPGMMGMPGRQGPPGPPGRDGGSSGLTIRDNAAALLGTGVTELQGQDSTDISELWAVVGASASLSYEVNKAASFAWTGSHSFGAALRLAGIFNNDVLGADQTDLAIGAVNRVSFITTGGAPPYNINSMVANAPDQLIAFVNRDGADRLTIRHDDGVTGTAANRWVVSGLESAILPPRTMLMGCYVSGSNRWFASGLVFPFFNTPLCAAGDQLQHDGTDWVRQNFIQFGSAAVAAGDIQKLSGDLALVGATVELRNVLDTANVLLNADGIRLEAAAAGDFVDVWANSGLRVAAGLSGTSQGFIKIVEGASALTNAAGEGQLLVENTAPCRLLYRDDTNVSWPVGYACVSTPLTANAAASGATTNLSCCTFTHQAGSLRVGSTFLYTGWYVYTHTAAATPTLTAELLINGAVVSACILTPQTLAATFTGKIEAIFTVRSIGAGGTVMLQMLNGSPAQVQASTVAGGSNDTATDAIDTTVSRSSELRIRMTTAVASNTLTVTNGYVQKLF